MKSIRRTKASAGGIMRNVLYCSFDAVPAPKGAAIRIRNLSSALARAGYRVHLLTVAPKTEEPIWAEQNLMYCPVKLGHENFLDRALAFREIAWQYMQKIKPHITHVRSIWEGIPGIAASQDRGGWLVCEANGFPSVELKYHYPDLAKNPALLDKLKSEEELLLRNAHCVIVPSRVTANCVAGKGGDEGKIVLIPNGADPDLFRPVANAPARSQAPWTIFYSGTFAPWQGIDLLLRASHKLRSDVPFEVVLVGSGLSRWREELRKEARRLRIKKRVRLLAPRPHDELASLIGPADVCVAPLRADERNMVQGCHPIKVLEYMACQKPVVAPDIPVIREILTHETTGLLYPADDLVGLAGALRRLFEDRALAERLGLEARHEVEKRFTWDHAAKRLLDCYNRFV